MGTDAFGLARTLKYNSTTIPSTGKKIKYQPFTVKEEKILVLAAESGDNEEITNAITNILEKCVTSPQDFRVSELALFDIEYLFLNIIDLLLIIPGVQDPGCLCGSRSASVARRSPGGKNLRHSSGPWSGRACYHTWSLRDSEHGQL